MPQSANIRLALTEASTFAVNANGSGGTPSNGGACRYWSDVSGNARHVTMPAGPTNPPLYRTNVLSSGHAMIDFTSGVNGALQVTDATLTSIQASNNWSVMVAGQVDPSWDGTSGGWFLAQYPGRWDFGNLNAGGNVQYSNYQTGPLDRTPVAGEWFVCCYTWDSAIKTQGVADGLQRGYVNCAGRGSPGGLAAASGAAAVAVGGYSANAFFWVGKVAAVYIWDLTLTPGDVYRGMADLYARFGRTVPTTRCVHMGNSLVGQPNVGYLVPQVAINLGDSIDQHFSLGWGGNQAVDLNSDAANLGSIFAALPSGPRKNCAVYSGTNDGAGGAANPATIVGQLGTFAASMRTAGAEWVVNCTLLPFHAPASADMTVFRPGYDSDMLSTGAGFSDAIADLAAVPVIGVNGVQTDTTYYQVDQVHPNQAGSALAAPTVASAITSTGVSFVMDVSVMGVNKTLTLGLTGTGTSWDSGTTFSADQGTINSKTFVDSTHVTLSFTAPATAQVCTFSDSLDSATAALTAQSFTASPSSVAAGSTTNLTLTGVLTTWNALGNSPTFAADHGTINSQTVVSATSTTPLSFTASGSFATATLTDPSSGATFTLTVTGVARRRRSLGGYRIGSRGPL